MKVTYIRWRDAAHDLEEHRLEDIGLIELHEVGFLVKETDEAVTLSMEHPGIGESVRLWLCIPKVNIVERKDLNLTKLLKPRRIRKKVMTAEAISET